MHGNITPPDINRRLTYVEELVAELIAAMPHKSDAIRALARAAEREGYSRCQETVAAPLALIVAGQCPPIPAELFG